jgi:hypothetical protein
MHEGGRPVTMRIVKTFRFAASALVLLALAGCSSGVKASVPQSPVDMGKTIGCDATQQSPTMFAREEALCGSPNDATYADIVTFIDSKNRDQWVQVAKMAGGVMVVGDSWAIIVNTQERANMVKSKLGGEIQ